MKNLSFRDFLRSHRSPVAKGIKADFPDIENWGEIRLHVRRQGMADDELVKVRALWREYNELNRRYR